MAQRTAQAPRFAPSLSLTLSLTLAECIHLFCAVGAAATLCKNNPYQLSRFRDVRTTCGRKVECLPAKSHRPMRMLPTES